eukprot:4356185-Pyramimonas_sp.AAC.1
MAKTSRKSIQAFLDVRTLMLPQTETTLCCHGPPSSMHITLLHIEGVGVFSGPTICADTTTWTKAESQPCAAASQRFQAPASVSAKPNTATECCRQSRLPVTPSPTPCGIR